MVISGGFTTTHRTQRESNDTRNFCVNTPMGAAICVTLATKCSMGIMDQPKLPSRIRTNERMKTERGAFFRCCRMPRNIVQPASGRKTQSIMDYYLYVIVNGQEMSLLVLDPDDDMMKDYENVFRALGVLFRWEYAM